MGHTYNAHDKYLNKMVEQSTTNNDTLTKNHFSMALFVHMHILPLLMSNKTLPGHVTLTYL